MWRHEESWNWGQLVGISNGTTQIDSSYEGSWKHVEISNRHVAFCSDFQHGWTASSLLFGGWSRSEFFAMRGKSPTGANGCFWKRGIVPVTGLIGKWWSANFSWEYPGFRRTHICSSLVEPLRGCPCSVEPVLFAHLAFKCLSPKHCFPSVWGWFSNQEILYLHNSSLSQPSLNHWCLNKSV